MTRLPTKKNWGRALENFNPELCRQLDEMYVDLVNAINSKPNRYVTSGADPSANTQLNSLFDIGDFYVRTDTNSAWIMTSRTTSTAVTWTKIT